MVALRGRNSKWELCHQLSYYKWYKKPHPGQHQTSTLSITWLGVPSCDSLAVLHSTGLDSPSPGPGVSALQRYILNTRTKLKTDTGLPVS